jgi:hypothetical protein
MHEQQNIIYNIVFACSLGFLIYIFVPILIKQDRILILDSGTQIYDTKQEIIISTKPTNKAAVKLINNTNSLNSSKRTMLHLHNKYEDALQIQDSYSNNTEIKTSKYISETTMYQIKGNKLYYKNSQYIYITDKYIISNMTNADTDRECKKINGNCANKKIYMIDAGLKQLTISNVNIIYSLKENLSCYTEKISDDCISL